MLRNSGAGSASQDTHRGSLGVSRMYMMLVDCAPPVRSPAAIHHHSRALYAWCSTIPQFPFAVLQGNGAVLRLGWPWSRRSRLLPTAWRYS